MKASIQFSILLMLNTLIVGTLTKPMAFTVPGFVYAIALIGSLILAYNLGRSEK